MSFPASHGLRARFPRRFFPRLASEDVVEATNQRRQHQIHIPPLRLGIPVRGVGSNAVFSSLVGNWNGQWAVDNGQLWGSSPESATAHTKGSSPQTWTRTTTPAAVTFPPLYIHPSHLTARDSSRPPCLEKPSIFLPRTMNSPISTSCPWFTVSLSPSEARWRGC